MKPLMFDVVLKKPSKESLVDAGLKLREYTSIASKLSSSMIVAMINEMFAVYRINGTDELSSELAFKKLLEVRVTDKKTLLGEIANQVSGIDLKDWNEKFNNPKLEFEFDWKRNDFFFENRLTTH